MSYVANGVKAYWQTRFINEFEEIRDRFIVEYGNLYDAIRDRKKEFDDGAYSHVRDDYARRIDEIGDEIDSQTERYIESKFGARIGIEGRVATWHTGVPDKELKIGPGLREYLDSALPDYRTTMTFRKRPLMGKRFVYAEVAAPQFVVPLLKKGDIRGFAVVPGIPVMAMVPDKRSSEIMFDVDVVPSDSRLCDAMDHLAENVFGIESHPDARDLDEHHMRMMDEADRWEKRNGS